MVGAFDHAGCLQAFEEGEVTAAAGGVQAAADEGDALSPVEVSLRVRHHGGFLSAFLPKWLRESSSRNARKTANAVCRVQ
jgi:hypothetical protein